MTAERKITMNNYSFDEIQIGHTETFEAVVNQRKMDMFAEITGDYSPRHTKENMGYGLMTASFLSTLVGMYLPGRNGMCLGVDVEFPNAYYVSENETILTVTGEVTEKVNVLQMLTLKVRITGADGKILLRGTMQVKVTGDIK